MEEITTDVSWIAVIVGTVVSFLAGWLWYSPVLFGKKWAEGDGVEMGDASEMPMGAMMAQVAGLLLMSWFVGVTAASEHLATVVLATVAFAVLNFSGGGFRKNSNYARFTDAGFWIVALIIMIICNGIF